jgi:hypothetical protein
MSACATWRAPAIVPRSGFPARAAGQAVATRAEGAGSQSPSLGRNSRQGRTPEQTADSPVDEGQALKQQTLSSHLPTVRAGEPPASPSVSIAAATTKLEARVSGTNRPQAEGRDEFANPTRSTLQPNDPGSARKSCSAVTGTFRSSNASCSGEAIGKSTELVGRLQPARRIRDRRGD